MVASMTTNADKLVSRDDAQELTVEYYPDARIIAICQSDDRSAWVRIDDPTEPEIRWVYIIGGDNDNKRMTVM
jgi:hypothetical protein